MTSWNMIKNKTWLQRHDQKQDLTPQTKHDSLDISFVLYNRSLKSSISRPRHHLNRYWIVFLLFLHNFPQYKVARVEKWTREKYYKLIWSYSLLWDSIVIAYSGISCIGAVLANWKLLLLPTVVQTCFGVVLTSEREFYKTCLGAVQISKVIERD